MKQIYKYIICISLITFLVLSSIFSQVLAGTPYNGKIVNTSGKVEVNGKNAFKSLAEELFVVLVCMRLLILSNSNKIMLFFQSKKTGNQMENRVQLHGKGDISAISQKRHFEHVQEIYQRHTVYPFRV